MDVVNAIVVAVDGTVETTVRVTVVVSNTANAIVSDAVLVISRVILRAISFGSSCGSLLRIKTFELALGIDALLTAISNRSVINFQKTT